MTLEKKIAELDSLERIQLDIEVDKLLGNKSDAQFNRILKDACTRGDSISIEYLIQALDRRYMKRVFK